jgi:hypothetical protein
VALLSDEEVFGSDKLLSDEEVFGPSPAPARSSYALAGSLKLDEPVARALRERAAPEGHPLDPMLRRDFVEQQREAYRSADPSVRLGMLREAAKRNDAQGRAAKVLLTEAEIQNRAGAAQERRMPTATQALARGGPPQPQRRGSTPPPIAPVAFPDLAPRVDQIAAQTPQEQVARERMAGLTLEAADATPGAVRDRASRVPRTIGAVASDTLTQLHEGVNSVKQIIASSINPDSAWAAELKADAERMEAWLSPQEVSSRELQRALLDAQDSEFGKAALRFGMFLFDPMTTARDIAQQGPIVAAALATSLAGSGIGAGVVSLVARLAPKSVGVANAILGGGLVARGAAAGATAGGVVAGAVGAGGDAAGQTYDAIMDRKKVSDDTLRQNPDVQALLAENDGDIEAARRQYATQRARMSQAIAGAVGALLGPLGAETAVARRVAGTRAGSALGVFAKDVGSEVLDESATAMSSNVGAMPVRPDIGLWTGVGEAAGAAAGFSTLTGGAGALAATARAPAPQQDAEAPGLAGALARQGFAPPVAAAPRIEEMPTRPFTPEEAVAAGQALRARGAVPPPQMPGVIPAEGVLPVGEATEVAARPGAAVPSGGLVSPRGEIAQRAQEDLRKQAAAKVPAAAPAAAPALTAIASARQRWLDTARQSRARAAEFRNAGLLAPASRLETEADRLEETAARVADLKPVASDSPEARAFAPVVEQARELTGIAPVPYLDARPGSVDGFMFEGVPYVNLARPQQAVQFTVAHELQHVIRQRAQQGDAAALRATAVLDRVWDMIGEPGRRKYAQEYLWREEIAGRKMTIEEALASPKLKDEMLSDFMGKRMTDKTFLKELARREPRTFADFIKSWVEILDGMIAKLRGSRDLGVKDIDQYIPVEKLEEAKRIALETASEWARLSPKNQKFADRAGLTEQLAPREVPTVAPRERDRPERERDAVGEGAEAPELPSFARRLDEDKLRESLLSNGRETIVDPIVKALNLTKKELASTSLGMMAGGTKENTFAVKKVGDLTTTINFLEARRRASGLRPLDLENATDRAVLARLLAAETLAAIRSAGDAVEWYDKTIRRMLGAMAVKYPELRSDPYAQNAFLAAIAISSQNQNVEDNLTFGAKQYEAWRRDKRFPAAGNGKSAGNMVANFELYNKLRDDMGDTLLYRFLRTPFLVSELNNAGINVNQELADELVLGSSVFGPKIGFGFFSNLTGNFEPITMDMWLMRLIGRLTGKLLAFDENKFAKQLSRLRAAFAERGGEGVFADQLDPDLVQRAETDTDAAVEAARRAFQLHEKDYRDNKADYKSGARVKSELAKASETLLVTMDSPRDVPASGGERRLLRDVVRRAVDLVAVHNEGRRVPSASLQALVWYPEQELYKALGVKLHVTSQDYAGAAEKVLKGQGYAEADIRAGAEQGPGRPRPVAGEQDASRDRPAGQEPGQLGPLEAGERASFLAERTERETLRREREQPSRVGVIFEVAPDPGNRRLVDAWRKLDSATRLRVSERIARVIMPKVLALFDNEAALATQIGSYLNDTNPSFAALLKGRGDALEITKTLGFVLAQDSMMVLAPQRFKGGEVTGALQIDIGDKTAAEVDAIYQALREIEVNGEQPIGGQSTINGKMIVLNFSPVPTEKLRQIVDDALGGAYTVNGAEVHAAFVEKKDYDYARPDADPEGDRGVARKRARALRAQAQRALETELRAAGISFSRAVGPEPSVGPPEPAVRPGRGGEAGRRAAQEAVAAWHYSTLPGLEFLSGSAYGRGIRGAERARLSEPGVDPRIKKRVYFYVPRGDGSLPAREAGLGPFRYEADLTGLLETGDREAMSRLPPSNDGNSFESAVLDAGYRGYVSRTIGMAVVLNADVPVRAAGKVDADRGTARPLPPQPVKRALMADEIARLEPRMADLQRDAPSAKLRMGTLSYAPQDAAAVERFLADEPAPAGRPGLAGLKVRMPVRIESTGETATLTVDAEGYMRELEQRRDALQRLVACVG